MESLKEVYKIGRGPSSSHTMGPERAAKQFKEKYQNAHSFRVYLYGSLAATGKGHMTDYIIIKTLEPKETEIVWDASFVHSYHTNYMKFEALDENKNVIGEWEVFSIGGGTIVDLNSDSTKQIEPYNLNKLSDIIKWCKENNKELWEYVDLCEGEYIWPYLKEIYKSMVNTVKTGIQREGYLPAKLKFKRKAKDMYEQAIKSPASLRLTKLIFAYALATSEENASAGIVVTSPTCGACGVLPGVLVAMAEEFNLEEDKVIKGLAIAGIIASLIKKNATVSGAEGGCQAEIGSACSMASAMAAYFLGASIDEIEYAAESGMEHALGMTCDPIGGYVIVPCIERNAVFATRAINTANYVMAVGAEHIISFDDVIITMAETGKDLCPAYRETSMGGLAKYYEKLLDKQK